MSHRLACALASALLFTTAPALAAPKPDLAVSLAPPSGAHVYEAAAYTATVSNIGNKDAAAVVLTIQLPVTHTSPTVYIMGTLGPRDPRCAVSGTKLVCSLGTVAKFTSTNVAFTISLPYSTAPLVFDLGVTTTTAGETNLANNHLSHTASLLDYAVPTTAPETAINRHCTGIGLTSFFECELFPSSISSHTTVLEADGSVSFPGAPPGYTGAWWMSSPDHLQFQYFDTGLLVAEFDGYGVDGSCFEGATTFPGSAYTSMYEVCLQ